MPFDQDTESLEPPPSSAATTKTKKTAATTARQKKTPQRPEQRSEVPEHRGQQRNKDLLLAALEVRLQFQAAPESGGRQQQQSSRSHQPFLCALIRYDRDDPLISSWRGFFHLPGQLRTGGGPPHEPFDRLSAWIFLCRVNPALGTPGEIHVTTGKKKLRTENLKVQFRNFLIELFRQ